MVWAAFCYIDKSDILIIVRDPLLERNGYIRNSYINAIEPSLTRL
jgi:hypothetical protein